MPINQKERTTTKKKSREAKKDTGKPVVRQRISV